MSETPADRFKVENSTTDKATCKNTKCKGKIAKAALRIGKVGKNPFSDTGAELMQWYHAKCIFDAQSRARTAKKKVESPDDMEGFDTLATEDQDTIKQLIEDAKAGKTSSEMAAPKKAAAKKRKAKDDSDDDDDKPRKRNAPRRATQKKKQVDSDEDDESEEEKPKKKTPKRKAASKKKKDSDEDAAEDDNDY